MRKNFFTVIAGAFFLLAFTACGPKYPNCFTDDHCRAQNQVCAQGVCKQCRDDSQCGAADACQVCNGYSCNKRPGCCTSDSDCPGKGRCWNLDGGPTGVCGGECGEGMPCPPGQRCQNDSCVPDVECGPSAPCPPGQQCVDGSCQQACQGQTVLFDFNESRIRLDQQTSLTANGECARARSQSLRIEGHCDERGSEEYNMALGERRANSAKRYLQNLGVSGGSMRTISYGEERPSAHCSNEGCWSKNRRAEFVFE